jgi:hypothetical protein
MVLHGKICREGAHMMDRLTTTIDNLFSSLAPTQDRAMSKYVLAGAAQLIQNKKYPQAKRS